MQSNVIGKTLLYSSLALASISPYSSATAQDKVPNFAGSWLELNVAPEKAMRLRIAQNGNELTEEVFGKLTIVKGVARGSPVQQCAPPFRRPGYDYDANPSVAVITMRLNGSTLRFDRDLHWRTPCDGHGVGTEHDSHLFQRLPMRRTL